MNFSLKIPLDLWNIVIKPSSYCCWWCCAKYELNGNSVSLRCSTHFANLFEIINYIHSDAKALEKVKIQLPTQHFALEWIHTNINGKFNGGVGKMRINGRKHECRGEKNTVFFSFRNLIAASHFNCKSNKHLNSIYPTEVELFAPGLL